VLELRHDEIRRLDDLPLGVDMASRNSCMEYEKISMLTVTHFLSSHTPMIAMIPNSQLLHPGQLLAKLRWVVPNKII